MKKSLITLVLAMFIMVLSASPAFAYTYGNKGDRTYDGNSFACTSCHKDGYNGNRNPDQDTVPHGSYTTTSDHCATCHQAHERNSAKLLPKPTLSETCNYCHDFTGAKFAIYRLNNPNDTVLAQSGHRVIGVGYADFNGTLDIPGGSDSNGGTATLITKGTGDMAQGSLSCDSCHTPHGMNVVNRYIGESDRNYSSSTATSEGWIFPSSRILRNTLYGPNNDTPTTVQNYGPQWCAACHQGRDNTNAGSFHNHPVDMTKNWGWGNSTVILPIGSNNVNDPRKNNVFVMRNDVGALDGNVAFEMPMCQQCHASARDVNQAFSATNPEQQYRNFPHQSTNAKLLVEDKDNLCLNCHTPKNLP